METNKQPSDSHLKYLSLIVGCLPAVSDVDCGVPNNASSEVIVQYTSTRVSSVIFYHCRQSGFAPSSTSAVCKEDGRWSPDPSKVVCRMVTTMMPPAPTPTQTGREKINIIVVLLTAGRWKFICAEAPVHGSVISSKLHAYVQHFMCLV